MPYTFKAVKCPRLFFTDGGLLELRFSGELKNFTDDRTSVASDQNTKCHNFSHTTVFNSSADKMLTL